MYIDEVSQTGIPHLLNLGPVLLYLGPVYLPYWANRDWSIGQNSVKYRPTVSYPVPAFHSASELHQKDLGINY